MNEWMFQLSCWNLPRYFKYGINRLLLNHGDQFGNILIESVYIKMTQKEMKIMLCLSKITNKVILWIKDANTKDLRNRMMMVVDPQ